MDETIKQLIEDVQDMRVRFAELEERVTGMSKALGIPFWWWIILAMAFMSLFIFILSDPSESMAEILQILSDHVPAP